MIKAIVKSFIGKIQAKRFQVQAEKMSTLESIAT